MKTETEAERNIEKRIRKIVVANPEHQYDKRWRCVRARETKTTRSKHSTNRVLLKPAAATANMHAIGARCHHHLWRRRLHQSLLQHRRRRGRIKRNHTQLGGCSGRGGRGRRVCGIVGRLDKECLENVGETRSLENQRPRG